MAITAATLTSDFDAGFLPKHMSTYIFERAAQTSVFQQLIPQHPLGYNGESIPVVTGRASAGWVSQGATKPASSGAISLKSMTPEKIAAIAVTSQEVVRANPGGYLDTVRNQLAESFAIGFDNAIAHDSGPDGTAGAGPFSTYLDQATKTAEIGATAPEDGGVYVDLNGALEDIVTDVDSLGRRYRLTGWALDAVLEPAIRGSVDANGRPFFADLPTDEAAPGLARRGTLLGRPSFMGEYVATANLTSVVGYAGDFGQAAWGAVGGISYSVSTEGSVTIDGELVSLWENNLVAIRAEAEYGFLLNDAAAIVKLTNVGNVPVTSS